MSNKEKKEMSELKLVSRDIRLLLNEAGFFFCEQFFKHFFSHGLIYHFRFSECEISSKKNRFGEHALKYNFFQEKKIFFKKQKQQKFFTLTSFFSFFHLKLRLTTFHWK